MPVCFIFNQANLYFASISNIVLAIKDDYVGNIHKHQDELKEK